MTAIGLPLRELNDCGCCEGLSVSTPQEVINRPGLSTIAYRVGTHAQFKESLLARLSESKLEFPSLLKLTTREDDDFCVALLDAWATVADVLTFYQECLTNESYLRTATERFSLLQLARLIGYELRPGVAASTYLAFTVDDIPGAPVRAIIDVGVKVSSVPAQGEKPQTFETIEQIEARAEWNALRPKMTQAAVPQAGDTQVYLQGIFTNLKVGDALLFVGSERKTDAKSTKWALQFVTAVSADAAANRTLVHWSEGLADVSTSPTIYALRLRVSRFGFNAPNPKVLSNETLKHYKKEDFVPKDTGPETPEKIEDWSFQKAKDTFDLDSSYPALVAGSWLVAVRGADESLKRQLFRVTTLAEASRADFGLSGRVTRIMATDEEPAALADFPCRETTIFAQSEELKVAETPINAPIERAIVVLANPPSGLRKGQWLAASGTDSTTGEPLTEVVTVNELDGAKLAVAPPLRHSYARDSFSLNANVAAATHGETVREVLGSGDAGQRGQKFTLRQPPLTYTSSPTPSGGRSTLEVRINDLLWHEVPTLFGRGPGERVYVTQTEDDGKTTLLFGDGQNGSRPPSGKENIRAVYRRGIGQEGLLNVGQLSTLMTRPTGIKGVSNPLNTTGAQDRESVADAKRNAPFTSLTLDRIVSLQDYEDFARAFAGIVKALAVWAWTGQSRGAFLTVAGTAGEAVEETSAVYGNLLAAMRQAGDPQVTVRVASYREARFYLAATLKCDPDYESGRVLAAVRDSLRSAFSFDTRQFGQTVALSEVVTIMQTVNGVIAVDVDALHRTDGIGGGGLQQFLPAAGPQADPQGNLLAAELLLLDVTSLENVLVAS